MNMNTYALAKFVETSGGVDARKRLQKSIFLIQSAGYDLDAKYFLHFYGPYSSDVAEAIDLLTQAKLLDEEPQRQPWGVQYSYKISDLGKKLLSEYENSPEGKKVKGEIKAYLPRFNELNELPLWTLELASTIAYYYKAQGNCNWVEAKSKTAGFKQVDNGAPVLDKAEVIAKKCVNNVG